MSEKADIGLRRTVTRISGDGSRPLLLPSIIANNTSSLITPSESTGQKRPLPVNQNKLSFDPKRLQPQKSKKLQKVEKDTLSVKSKVSVDQQNSSVTYEGFLHFDQAGSAIIGSTNTKDCTLVAIKTSKGSTNLDMQHLTECKHENVVQLLDVFDIDDNEICMVYEQMEVSLRLINGNPYIKWKAYEIAAISKEVCSNELLIDSVSLTATRF